MRLVVIATLLLVSALSSVSVDANTGYISDELTVPLRSGPSGQHRILHRGLPSGTTLEILSVDEAAGFSQIRTSRGTEGWVRTQYLVYEPIAKMRLAEAQARAQTLTRQLREARSEIDQLKNQNQDQRRTSQAGAAKVSELEAELSRIEEISASAIDTHQENLALKEVNARLQDELDDVSEARDMLAENASNQGIMLGAGFILLGLIAGVLIKARPQRSAWS